MDSDITRKALIRDVGPADRDELTVSIPSELGRIEATVDMVANRCIDFGLRAAVAEFNLRVALTEALANAIMYGNGMDSSKSVNIRAHADEGRILVEVADEGPGFDPGTVPDPTTPERIRLPDGRGIFLIRKLVDDVSFSERGNSICMVLRQS